MLQKVKAVGSWIWEHKLATAALLIPVVGVAAAATVVTVQDRRKADDGATPEERERAKSLERAAYDGSLR